MSNVLAQRVAELSKIVEGFVKKSKKINQLTDNSGYENGMLVAVYSPVSEKTVKYPFIEAKESYYDKFKYITGIEDDLTDLVLTAGFELVKTTSDLFFLVSDINKVESFEGTRIFINQINAFFDLDLPDIATANFNAWQLTADFSQLTENNRYNFNFWLKNGGGYESLKPLESFVVKGTSIGKWSDGDTVPTHASSNERWLDAGRLQVLPIFYEPVVGISATTNPDSSTEVGTILTDITFTANFSKNDGGNPTNYKIFKDGTEILDSATVVIKKETFQLSTTPILFKASIDYAAGTTPKDDNLDPPNSIANTIVAGTDDSNNLSYRGYRAVFYGSVATKNTTSANVRANLTKRLENSGNTFILNTGTTNKIFQIWLPTGKDLDKVIDLDALNFEVTTSYISEELTVNDIGTNPITGTLYTMTASVPYTTSHRHQITIS